MKKYTYLSKRRERIIQALVEVACPDYLQDEGIGQEIIDNIDVHLASMPTPVRVLFMFNYTFLNISPILFGYSLRTFRMLPKEKRTRFMHKADHSRLDLRRLAAQGARTLVLLYYYDDPRVRHSLNYDVEKHVAEKQKERKRLMGRKYRVAYK